MVKQGIHNWAWLVILMFGGLLMIFSGVQDLLLFFLPDLVLVSSWYNTLPVVGLICGIIVLLSAILNIFWGWQLRDSEGSQEILLAKRVALISTVSIIADWISGYYGFGSLIALITSIWLMRKGEN